MATITLTDEHGFGNKTLEKLFELTEDTLTLRELLRLRIYEEATEFNAKASESFSGLVQPEGGRKRQVNWQEQFDRATEAFKRRTYIVLVDDEQVGDLEATLTLRTGTQVTFLKLVPLVGG